jgi:preprotein translocase subunit SecD
VTTRLNGFFVANPNDPKSQFAIVLDGKVISAPRAEAIITDGSSQITGTFTETSAKSLADKLKFGALPISFDIQSEQQISATLGAEQLQMGLLAGIIGLLLVVVYSLFQYRALGFVTILSLVVAGGLTYLAIAILGWTQNYRLSLAGVAGLIVAIGQTADSFIVYFERIRDELREGRGLIAAVENGWRRAKRTVLASKAVNLLAAVVLYFVAVGNVRGFAFTLGLTAIADLMVVFMFTHPTLQLLARTRFFGEGHRFSGLDPARLGAVPLYRGAGRLRSPSDVPVRVKGKNAPAAAEAERRQTIAERRLAAKQEQMAGSSAGSQGAAKENK